MNIKSKICILAFRRRFNREEEKRGNAGDAFRGQSDSMS